MIITINNAKGIVAKPTQRPNVNKITGKGLSKFDRYVKFLMLQIRRDYVKLKKKRLCFMHNAKQHLSYREKRKLAKIAKEDATKQNENNNYFERLIDLGNEKHLFTSGFLVDEIAAFVSLRGRRFEKRQLLFLFKEGAKNQRWLTFTEIINFLESRINFETSRLLVISPSIVQKFSDARKDIDIYSGYNLSDRTDYDRKQRASLLRTAIQNKEQSIFEALKEIKTRVELVIEYASWKTWVIDEMSAHLVPYLEHHKRRIDFYWFKLREYVDGSLDGGKASENDLLLRNCGFADMMGKYAEKGENIQLFLDEMKLTLDDLTPKYIEAQLEEGNL